MKKILIVDDDEDDKDFLCEAIHGIDRSAHCICVSDGLHALRLINDESFIPPDYIFLDLNMPKMGGIQCLQKIRRLPGYESVPVVIYSSSELLTSQFDLSKSGPVKSLVKPGRMSELNDSLQEIFKDRSPAM